MTPSDKIAELCKRHAVSPSFGRRLLPLVRRAFDSPAEKRARLLALVTRSFVEEARRTGGRTNPVLSPGDRRLLRTVGRILHGWDPPDWMSNWNWGSPGNAPD